MRLPVLLALAAYPASMIVSSTAWGQVGSTSVTAVTTEITEPASISVLQDLTFTVVKNNVNTILSGASAGIVVNSPNASAMSLSVPATVNVVRVGSADTISIQTIGSVSGIVGAPTGPVSGVLSGGPFSGPVAVSGNLDGGVLSFSVGGLITLSNNAVAGNYQGVLTVVAQYD